MRWMDLRKERRRPIGVSEVEGRGVIERQRWGRQCAMGRRQVRQSVWLVCEGRRAAMTGVERIALPGEGIGPKIDAETGPRLAVLVPCYNEEAAIAKVVADFRVALPEATVFVYDNNSGDRTVEVARAAGAVVRREMHQ